VVWYWHATSNSYQYATKAFFGTPPIGFSLLMSVAISFHGNMQYIEDAIDFSLVDLKVARPIVFVLDVVACEWKSNAKSRRINIFQLKPNLKIIES
jgi:hypothetical protein